MPQHPYAARPWVELLPGYAVDMTDAAPRTRADVGRVSSHVFAWVGFVVTHAWLAWLCLYAPGFGMNDVSIVYRQWTEQAVNGGGVVGIDVAWVYPILAMVPMVTAALFGPANYVFAWLGLVIVLNAGAFALLIRGKRAPVAWWWLSYLLLLGPIALARIDAVTISLGIVGVVLLATRPRAAGIVLAVATWVKVWPAALIVAALVALPSRRRILLSGAVVSLVVIAVAVALGGGARVLSFVTEQTGRGLQIEAPVTTFWMWAAFTGQPGASLYFDSQIITYQVMGAGVDAAAGLMTPLMAAVVAAVVLLGVRAVWAGAPAAELLPPLSLALVMALIAFNKVGSPQFIGWIAVPIVLGLATRLASTEAVSFRVPATLTLVIGALTQVLYPYLYGYLVTLNAAMLVTLTLRNLLEFALLGWAIRSIILAARTGRRDLLSRS